MGTRQLNRLSAKTIVTKRRPGLYGDGGGLYLQITPSGSKTWIFRYRSPVTQKLRDMGLGPVHSVGLPGAREKATAHRSLLLSGLDPIEAREQETRRRAIETAKAVTFSQCAASYIESHRPGWTSKKHTLQWEATNRAYCEPVIGSLPVQEVDTGLVLKILEPIWANKPQTASRLRGRIENILDWAKARGYRSGENPARWKGHLNQLLPALARKDRIKHYEAMPFPQVGEFVARLRKLSTISARCLEFTILCAARTNEATNVKPEDIDLVNATWTVPAPGMKTKREHRVPLSPRAMEIVREMLAHKTEYVFSKTTRRGGPLSNMTMLDLLYRMGVDVTVHGFRSSFRDWAAERTGFPREVCEMALAHTISNSAEAAYRRGDLFEKRRKLMDAWANFINAPRIESAVIPMKHAA
jgi:integrase